jgi:hypothetical protein
MCHHRLYSPFAFFDKLPGGAVLPPKHRGIFTTFDFKGTTYRMVKVEVAPFRKVRVYGIWKHSHRAELGYIVEVQN